MIFIVARNKREAEECAREHGLDRNEWKYVIDETVLFGLSELSIIFAEGYLEHSRIVPIMARFAMMKAVGHVTMMR